MPSLATLNEARRQLGAALGGATAQQTADPPPATAEMQARTAAIDAAIAATDRAIAAFEASAVSQAERANVASRKALADAIKRARDQDKKINGKIDEFRRRGLLPKGE